MICRNTGCPAEVLLPQTLCSLKRLVNEVALGLGDNFILDGLKKHLSIISEYNTLYRQLYCISQRPLEMVTQIVMHVCSKVSAIRSMYPGGIPDEKVEEVKHKHFFGSL